MNKQELRIGNYIQDIESGRIGSVLTIGEKKCAVKMPFSKLLQSYDEFQNVELSEEWLLKFGFEKNDLDEWGDDSRIMLFIPAQFEEGYLVSWGDSLIKSIKYVHQLQNLFFALVGEELTIKN